MKQKAAFMVQSFCGVKVVESRGDDGIDVVK